jgi:hypothetical protein
MITSSNAEAQTEEAEATAPVTTSIRKAFMRICMDEPSQTTGVFLGLLHEFKVSQRTGKQSISVLLLVELKIVVEAIGCCSLGLSDA